MAITTERVNFTMPIDLVNEMKEYCDSNGLAYSAFVSDCVRQSLQAKKMLPDVQSLLSSMAKAFDGVLTGQLKLNDAKAEIDRIDANCEAIKGALKMD